MSKAQKKKEVGMFNFPKEVSKHCYNSEMWEIKSYFRSLPNKMNRNIIQQINPSRKSYS